MPLFRQSFAVLALVAASVAPSYAGTVVLDFEDRPSYSNTGLTNYHWVSFDDNFFTYATPQNPYNPSSGVNRLALNNNDSDLGFSTFTFDVPGSTFVGAYIAGVDAFAQVYFNLYLGGSLVGSSLAVTPSATPSWLASGYSGVVDQVQVYGRRGFFVLDDITFSNSQLPDYPTSVPDAASTLALATGAMLALVVVRRRR